LAAKGLSLHGTVHGGQQPIAGAHVYLLAAASSAYGAASISLLDPGMTGYSDSLGGYTPTDAGGSWNISGDYACTPNQQVYVYVLGGDPGAGVNSASGLMAVLGNCPGSGNFITATPYVWVNEVSTVAAAYAMAPYAVDATHVASSGSALALTGIANAFANASNLADLPSGQSLATTPGGTGTVPQAQINLLANVIAACVNSTGPASAECTVLLGEATSDGTPGGTAPSDTASAMIDIAHNPGANVADLFNLPPAIAPFSPSPSTQPNDFTIAITFTAGLSAPSGLAVDGLGNVWVANQGSSTISAITSLGVPLSGSPYSGNGVAQPAQIAIDAANNIWVANAGGNSLSLFDDTGTPIAGSAISGGGLAGPGSISVGDNGQVWAASAVDNSVTLLATTGTPSISAITSGGLNLPSGIAVDPSSNTWVINQGDNSVSVFDSSGTPLLGAVVTGYGLNVPSGISIDGSGNAWIADTNDNSLTVLTLSGTSVTGTTFSGGGIVLPVGTAFDGAGNVWVANSTGNGVTELSSAGAAMAGSPFVESGIANAVSIAVDGSGSVWIADLSGNSLTEIIGSAAPAVTPIATAVNSGTTGILP
jgi:sugar lactone lactonase YvrE